MLKEVILQPSMLRSESRSHLRCTMRVDRQAKCTQVLRASLACEQRFYQASVQEVSRLRIERRLWWLP